MKLLVIGILLFTFVVERVLNYLNIKNWSPVVPEPLRDTYTDEKYSKARDYAVANYTFDTYSSTYSMMLLLGMLLFGGFGVLDEWLRSYTENPVLLALAFFGILSVASDLLTIPFSIYHVFVLEEKFGFNKMTVKTFLLDKLKGYLIGAILGGLVLFVLIKLLALTGDYFALFAWLFMIVIMMFGTMFYASWILPLFNKLTPLPEGELRTAIEDYSKQNNFPLANLYVMDGSKRSAKANAFFSGLGKKKKIVLYDTLINNHTTEELVAVLAHEIGHYKLKHTRSGLITGIVNMGIMLFLFSKIQGSSLLSEALSANQPSFHISLLAFSLLYSPLSMLIGIYLHRMSRKYEFQADSFARTTNAAQPLISALKKLSADSLSNLTPHPAYVYVHYSHPPLLERIERLEVV